MSSCTVGYFSDVTADPISPFRVLASDMIYTGDIETRAKKTGARTAIGDVSLTNREANARAALHMKVPAVAAALKTLLLACRICRNN